MIDVISEPKSVSDNEHKKKREKAITCIDPDTIIGVKHKDLHNVGDRIFKSGDAPAFMRDIPHTYFEENCIHAYILNKIGGFDECVSEIQRFLPYVDNWLVCDMIHPKVLAKYPEDTFLYVCDWINSDRIYSKRLGINTMADIFTTELFHEDHIKLINNIKADNYYVELAVERYFTELIIHHYDDMMTFIYKDKLSSRTLRRTVSRALKNPHISDKIKSHLAEFAN